METTRHFVATVYPVHEGTALLHEHERLEMWLPPGGHVDRDELPHEAALRECYEETGLEVELVAPVGDVEGTDARSIPEPQHFLLEDINVYADGSVGHQHVDFVYYGRADARVVDPVGRDEATPDVWEWFTPDDLERRREDLPEDVVDVARRAIETVSA